jgi:predicted aspartyl protease
MMCQRSGDLAMQIKCVGAIVWSLAWGSCAGATEERVPAQADDDRVLEELIVEAHEPRYAAPTRRDRIGRVWVAVTIDGKGPFRLVVDTGATTSAIVTSVAKRLGLSISRTSKVLLQGATGVDKVPYVTAEQMEVGDLLFSPAKLLIVPDVFGGADGVLGVQGLPDVRIHIDFRRDLTEIEYARDKEWPPGESMEFSAGPGRHARVDLQVGGVSVKAVIDTGAQQTIGNDRLREALLLRWRRTQAADIVGVTMDVTHAKSIRIPSITFGSGQVRDVDVSFGDLPIFEHWRLNGEPALLLGMDVIDRLETFQIDYQQRKLHVRARGR